MKKGAIDFISHDYDIVLLSNFNKQIEGSLRDDGTRGVVRIINDDHSGIWAYETFQFFNVQLPVFGFVSSPEVHLGSQTLRDLVQLLISRIMANHMVSIPNQTVEHCHVGSNCTRGNQDIICLKWLFGRIPFGEIRA